MNTTSTESHVSPTKSQNAPRAGFSFPTFVGGMVLGIIVGGLAAAFLLPMVDPILNGGSGKVTNSTARPKGAPPETGPNLRVPETDDTKVPAPTDTPQEPAKPADPTKPAEQSKPVG